MSLTLEHVFFHAVKVLKPTRFSDNRGYFEETFRADVLAEHGITETFVQDNHSRSAKGVLRGMHYQTDMPMGKLLWVPNGTIQLVEVDVRPDSPTFGEHVSISVDDENGRIVWIPPGFANGFCVLSATADVHYKCTAYYNPNGEHAIQALDKGLGINWTEKHPIMSVKDKQAAVLR